MERISNRKQLIALRERCAGLLRSQRKQVLICAGTGCVAGGSLQVFERLKTLMEEREIPCTVTLDHGPHEHPVGMKKSGCHGFCECGPLLRIEPMGLLYIKVKVEDCEEILEKSILRDEVIDRLIYHDAEGNAFARQDDIPFYRQQTRVALEHCGHINAESIQEYIAVGGYCALEKALFEMTPEQIVEEISASSLRGRGGGGFPTGKKWRQVLEQKSDIKYVVCNGDEGDPGAFMDRSMMEGDPHRVIEGMIVAGIATGAHHGYIYVRAEYPLAVARLQKAIAQAEELGLLGEHILGSDFSFDLKISQGAGAFVCGEGSALTASIEGKRGMPRVKPPRTVEKGLFEKPTVLNNVETFCNVPPILNRGAAWYQTIGPEKNHGTKAFALTGNVCNTGLIEVPMGTTLRTVVEDIGGGVPGGKKFKAAQTGGPSGGCIPASLIDTPIDYESLSAIGSMMGSGGLIVMDEDNCMVDIAKFYLEFIVDESCGKCSPCRIGTKRLLDLLTKITEGNGEPEDLDTIEELCHHIKQSALCGLGQTAPNPVLSTLTHFREEFEAHIYEKRCPAGVCKALIQYIVDPTKCKGCTRCAQGCPTGAISGAVRAPHIINQSKCIKCGACMDHCRFDAIYKQ